MFKIALHLSVKVQPPPGYAAPENVDARSFEFFRTIKDFIEREFQPGSETGEGKPTELTWESATISRGSDILEGAAIITTTLPSVYAAMKSMFADAGFRDGLVRLGLTSFYPPATEVLRARVWTTETTVVNGAIWRRIEHRARASLGNHAAFKGTVFWMTIAGIVIAQLYLHRQTSGALDDIQEALTTPKSIERGSFVIPPEDEYTVLLIPRGQSGPMTLRSPNDAVEFEFGEDRTTPQR